MSFESYMKANPEKVNAIVKQLVIDTYRMTSAVQVAVNYGEGPKVGIILKMPDNELNMTLFLPHGKGKGQVIKAKAVDFEDDLVLGIEITEDLGILDLARISQR